MQGRYKVNGHYKQEEAQGEVEGDIIVDDNGIVTGTVNDKGTINDKLSAPSRRAVTGKMTRKNGNACLDLLCKLADETSCNILYLLVKPEETSAEGKYTGSWIPVKRIANLNLKGSFEARGGEIWHYGEITQLVPYKRDLRPQHVELTLKRTA